MDMMQFFLILLIFATNFYCMLALHFHLDKKFNDHKRETEDRFRNIEKNRK